MLEMKTTRQLEVGDRATMDDMEIRIVESGWLITSGGWLVAYVDIDTNERHELDIDPTDVDVPVWEVHNPE